MITLHYWFACKSTYFNSTPLSQWRQKERRLSLSCTIWFSFIVSRIHWRYVFASRTSFAEIQHKANSMCFLTWPCWHVLTWGNVTSIEEITVLHLGLPAGTVRKCAKWHPLSHHTDTFPLRSLWHYLLSSVCKPSLTRFIFWIWTGYQVLKYFLLPLLISQVLLHVGKWL